MNFLRLIQNNENRFAEDKQKTHYQITAELMPGHKLDILYLGECKNEDPQRWRHLNTARYYISLKTLQMLMTRVRRHGTNISHDEFHDVMNKNPCQRKLNR